MDKVKEKENNIKKLGSILKKRRNDKGLSLRNIEDILQKKGIKLSYAGVKKNWRRQNHEYWHKASKSIFWNI